eukprot:Trichotokara_eunicae@DN914_c0_g1_i1.p1
MIHFIFLISRQGKVRLAKWFNPISQKQRHHDVAEVTQLVVNRPPRVCNFLEWRDKKVVYRRYASLYFTACVDKYENELIVLEILHQYVEILDRYFGNVCELDLIFNFHKALHILDEVIMGGEIQESSKKTVLRVAAAQDTLASEVDDKRLIKKA